MIDSSAIKQCLAVWPSQLPPDSNLEDNSCERLRKVLHDISHHEAYPGVGDLAGLIQHVMRRERLLFPNAGAWTVPRGSRWPDSTLWRLSGLKVLSETLQTIMIEAPDAWSAEWLPDSHHVCPLEAALRETQRRQRSSSEALKLDPALRIECGLPYTSYSCYGQQQAVHAALLLCPEATLVVNLPTGSGKSLVAWAAAMLAEPGMLTVIVLPTVALAIDQERQMLAQFRTTPAGLPDRLAWHGSLPEDEKSSIRMRLREGSQRVLFASPEAVTGPLCRELFATAEAGRLKYFVVDEAHLVSQWGTEFRPEFQSMAGLRRELISCCPQPERRLRTLLLSATLTQDTVDVLQDLFSDAVFDVISAVHLRPEPEYWISHAKSQQSQAERILELVRVVPRPFLLYVTEPKHADAWTQNLNNAGFQRVGCVHGRTRAQDRQNVIDDWRAGRIDCVVATSAFGLGMDKGDVRTVIHACAPETVDRFYQEVGRGGRDGKACVSFLVYTDRDLETAQGLSKDCFISVQRGLERWKLMMDNASGTERDGIYRLNLNTLPPDKSQITGANRAWNLRTLLMLNRARLIRLESFPPPNIQRIDRESEEHLERRRQQATEQYFNSSYIRVLENDNRDPATWKRLVEPLRNASFQRDQRNFNDLRAVIRGDEEIANVLTSAYTLRRDGMHVTPIKVCGGCPRCRMSTTINRHCRSPHCEPGRYPLVRLHQRLHALMRLNGNEVLLVSCEGDLQTIVRQLQRTVLPTLVESGIAEVALPHAWDSQRTCQELYRKSPHGFLIHRAADDVDRRREQIAVPRVTVFFPETNTPFNDQLLQIDRPLHIIFCRSDVRDPNRPNEHFFDRAHHLSYTHILGSLQS